ncbi:arrestin [Echinococcus multilocularis]|uniref:Arrestin n=1 Tax=Echinococcus multilocularis TaxID=6211 RepID=A0A068YAX5_ECHMU|nr:arrestin [Echinococcus multilocularis]
MAIDPGDSRLPLYRDGTVKPVWRKLSPCKSVGLYLLHRDYWSGYQPQHERQHTQKLPQPSECSNKPGSAWNPEFRPEHNGIVEGIAHVNPWMLKYKSRVYAEVEARYSIHRTELDAFDFENDNVIFSTRVTLNPPLCDEDTTNCFATPPKDLHQYSAELRQLYEKLGGPCASKPLKFENLTSSGVLPGKAYGNRMEHTFIPPTEATKCTEHPDLPYVTYNFPFRFDINSGPDSIMLKSNKPSPIGKHSVPKNRRELHLDAIYGFHEGDDESDLEEPSPETAVILPRIRHPRQPIENYRGIKKIDLRMQSFKDCFHADSYPWRQRHKRRPKDGIYWSVRVYVINPNALSSEAKDLAELKIRKLTFLPLSASLHHRPPPQVLNNYCLAVVPGECSDAGVITLAAKLDKIFYAPGDPIHVNMKIYNISSRVIQQITVEVIQCIQIATISNKVWRSSICKREITAENSEAEMPILPKTENLRLRCRLNPWPVEAQYAHLFRDKLHKLRPRVPIEAEAFTLNMPTEPNLFYGAQQPARYEEVAQYFVGRHKPAFSTLQGIVEHILTSNSPISIRTPEPSVDEKTFEKDPYDHHSCVRHKMENIAKQCSRPPMDQPHQYPIFKDYEIYGEELDYSTSVQRMLAPQCTPCDRTSVLRGQPVYVNYEVVVSAVLRPQNLPDPLAQDALLDECQLGSGLLNPPKGEIVGTRGPRVALPAIFSVTTPQPEMPVPVANYNVDPRQDSLPKIQPKVQLWSPSDGRGFFLVREQRKVAPCTTSDQNTSL